MDRADREREMAENERRRKAHELEEADLHDANEPVHRRAAELHDQAAGVHDRAAELFEHHDRGHPPQG